MSGRGRGAPFGNSAKKQLRRPMASTVSPVPPSGSSAGSGVALEDLETVSQQFESIDISNGDAGLLNINASEFVPKTSLSVSATEFVPGYGLDPALAQEESMDAQSEVQDPALTILYDAMNQLIFEPGRFDSIARQLTQDLNTVIKEYSTLENLAEVILESGINEPNFRYTGARLCDYLSLHLTLTLEGANIRQIIMQKCNREFRIRQKLLDENAERLRGFLLFMAELFQQLEIQVNAVVQRVQVLGKAIPDLIYTLASKPVKENVKCIVQTLKLCGSVLEEEERAANMGTAPVLDKLFAFLGELKQSPELEEPILAEMLSNLIALRDTNWGHADTAANAGDAQDQVPLPGLGTYELEPVFYAPDGQVLTMEEYDFLQEYGINDDENFGEVAWSTGEDGSTEDMGPEAEAAYEKFLTGQM
eukprot:TRINITY_DN4268_c0_g2_i1.p1 TRINITY_DN4268_c0_g2~~TRINITY_DN4268_c0_g2_i1.p1  ORF type:complete len:420 (+),score=101.32 TRINITY_DN4268_c0_g2_i1:53-1312(+)